MGDMVFIKVGLYKYVMRFDKKGKLASRFIRLPKVLK